jgi:hypothetical protein
MKKVLVILAHPRLGSYCNALSQAYERGAVAAGAEVRKLDDGHARLVEPLCLPRGRSQRYGPSHLAFLWGKARADNEYREDAFVRRKR